MIRAEIPLIGIRTSLPIPPKKNLPASLAVKQFENSCAARTRERGTIMEPPNRTRCYPALRGIAIRIRAYPQTLQVPEEQVGPDRQDGTPFRRTPYTKSGQQTLSRLGPASIHQSRKQRGANFTRRSRPCSTVGTRNTANGSQRSGCPDVFESDANHLFRPASGR